MLIKDELRFIKKLKELEKYNIDSLDDVERQLIRGDKFEMMWLDLEKIVNKLNPPDEFRGYGFEKVSMFALDVIKRKYFPAPRVKFTPFTEGYAQGYKAGLDFLEARRKRGM